MPGSYNFYHVQGDAFSRIITWKDSSGTPVNLTGYTGKMEVKDVQTGLVVLTFVTTNSTMTLGGAAGTITLTQTGAAMTMAKPEYTYDLVLISASSAPTTILGGTFFFTLRITTL